MGQSAIVIIAAGAVALVATALGSFSAVQSYAGKWVTTVE